MLMEGDLVSARLRKYLIAKSWTARDFERFTGLGNGTCAKIGKSTRATTYDRISKSGIDLNVDWLRSGDGEMLKPNSAIGESNARLVGGVFTAGDKDAEALMVDFVPVSAMASFVESLAMGGRIELEKLPLIPMGNERNEVERLRVFEVDGDSMFPTIPSGALILAKEIPENSWQYAEGVVVAVYNEFVVVKRVARNCLLIDNYIALKSDNEDYGEMIVALADIRGLYKAKRIISSEIR